MAGIGDITSLDDLNKCLDDYTGPSEEPQDQESPDSSGDESPESPPLQGKDDLDKSLQEFKSLRESDDFFEEDDQDQAEAHTIEELPLGGERKKVLIVLGVHLARRNLKKLLQNDYIFLETDRADNALTMIRLEKPDVVFIDNNLPSSDGIEIVRQMRQLKIPTPVIMAFNTISGQHAREIDKLRLSAYFTHPLDYTKLVRTIGDILSRPAPVYPKETASEKKQLANLSMTISAGRMICQEGKQGKECFLIKSGKVRVYRTLASGKEVDLAELGGGDIFGEMALVNPRPRSASVIAVKDTELYVLTKDNFITMIMRKPEFALKLVQVLCLRLEKADAMIDKYILSLKQ